VTGHNLVVDGGTSTIVGANQLKVPHLQWTQPGTVAKDKLWEGIAELPANILRDGIPGIHFPAEESSPGPGIDRAVGFSRTGGAP